MYKHVGGWICANGDMLPEARSHIGAMWGSLKSYDKLVIDNAHIDRAVRLAGTRSVALVHLEWNCHVWPPLSRGAETKLETARVACLRRVLKMCSRADRHVADDQVWAEGGLNQRETGTVSRLRFLPRLIMYGPQAVWAIVKAAGCNRNSWLSQIAGDADWLRKCGPSESIWTDVPEGEIDLERVTETINASPSRWKAAIARARMRVTNLKKIKFEWEAWDSLFLGKKEAEAEGAEPGQKVECPYCDKIFPNTPSVLLHLCREHDRKKSKVQEALDGTRCQACLTEHHTTKRLLLHWHSAKACHELTLKWAEADEKAGFTAHEKAAEDETPGLVPPEKMPAYKMPGPLTSEKTEARSRRSAAERQAEKWTPEKLLARYLGQHEYEKAITAKSAQRGAEASPGAETSGGSSSTTLRRPGPRASICIEQPAGGGAAGIVIAEADDDTGRTLEAVIAVADGGSPGAEASGSSSSTTLRRPGPRASILPPPCPLHEEPREISGPIQGHAAAVVAAGGNPCTKKKDDGQAKHDRGAGQAPRR
jgi:hypothetical protein